MAKQCRLPFPSLNNLFVAPFDLIYCDVWRLFHTHSTEGFRYFFTIVDDCTQFTWVYFLKSKADIVTILTQSFFIILTQFDKKIMSDLITPLNWHFLIFFFFRSQGVVSFHSCIATPQQNSVVEKKILAYP